MKVLHRFRLHVGPTLVHPMAEKCQEAGITVTCQGTAHLYLEVETDSVSTDSGRCAVLELLRKKHGCVLHIDLSDLEPLRGYSDEYPRP